MRLVLLLLVTGLVATAAVGVTTPQCMTQGGSPVDWWAMIKFPHISGSKNVNVAAGIGYTYIDAKGTKLTIPSTNLNSTSSPLQATLAPLYANHASPDVAYALWNDEWPSGQTTTSYGHTKGVVFFTKSGGFYLVHSVPRFPAYLADGYHGFPLNEITYGQSFLCLSVGYSQFNAIGLLMQRSDPWLYEHSLPSSFTGLSDFAAALAGTTNSTPGVTIETVTTAGGTPFVGFYKNKEWNNDLYEGLIAPAYKSGLRVESWMNGAGPLPSYCTPQYAYDVLNVRTLSATDSAGVVIAFKETTDHSKWAVAESEAVTCIGGINRMLTQFKRGGGVFCRTSQTLWSAFSGLIATADTCPSLDEQADEQ